MRNGLWALACALCLSAFGCTSSIEASCEKAKECDELGSQTVEQCVSEGEADKKKYEDDADCKTILEKAEDFDSCTTGLSCDEREKILSNDYKCKSELEALAEAIKADNGKCGAVQVNP